MVNLADAQVLVYQPQVRQWTDNQLTFRAALAIKPTGAKAESFGVIFASTRTQVDKVLRTVVFENMTISKIDFPTLPERGAAYGAELQTQFAQTIRTISLDRLEHSPALAGIKPPPVAVQNNPPWVIVSYAPAILVPIDGAPVMQTVPSNPQFQRVINTRALILQSGAGQPLYIHVYDGWLESNSISGPWSQSFNPPPGINEIAQALASSGAVDMLDGGPKVNPKPSLANGVPTIFTSQVPAELIVFNGQPDFQPVVGTQLLWAANTTSDVLIDIANNNYYVLISGRWFLSNALTGPVDVRGEQCAAGGLREHPAAVAGGRCAADRGRHAAGPGGGDLQFDPADGDGAAQERPDLHAEFRRSAAVAADRRHLALVCGELVRAADPGGARCVLFGGGRRVVHGGAAHRPVDHRHVGSGRDLHHPGELAALLRDLCEDLPDDAGVRVRGLHAGLSRNGGFTRTEP